VLPLDNASITSVSAARDTLDNRIFRKTQSRCASRLNFKSNDKSTAAGQRLTMAACQGRLANLILYSRVQGPVFSPACAAHSASRHNAVHLFSFFFERMNRKKYDLLSCGYFYLLPFLPLGQPESEGLSVRVLKAGHFLLVSARYARYTFIFTLALYYANGWILTAVHC